MKNLLLIFFLLLSINTVLSQNKNKSAVLEPKELTKDLAKVKVELIVIKNNINPNRSNYPYYKNKSQEVIELQPTTLLNNYQPNITVEALKTNEVGNNTSTNSIILAPVKLSQNYVKDVKVDKIEN